jgi:hypothetical protein
VGSACKPDAHAAEAVLLHVQLSCAAGTAPLQAASVHGLQWSRPNSCWTACGEADWELLPQQQRWPQQVCHRTQQLSDRLLFQKIVCGHTSECGYCLSCVPQSMLLLTPQILLLIPCCFVSLSRSFSHLAAGVVHSCLCHHLAGQQRSKLLPAIDAAGRPARRQHQQVCVAVQARCRPVNGYLAGHVVKMSGRLLTSIAACAVLPASAVLHSGWLRLDLSCCGACADGCGLQALPVPTVPQKP